MLRKAWSRDGNGVTERGKEAIRKQNPEQGEGFSMGQTKRGGQVEL